MTELIRYSVEDQIATTNRPEKRNAMLSEFIGNVGRAGEDAEAQVVSVTGAGGAFCTGTDLAAVDGPVAGMVAEGGQEVDSF